MMVNNDRLAKEQ